jgi:hypothetical protein
MALSASIQAFEARVVRPALQEVVDSPALARDYQASLLDDAYCDWSDDIDELIQSLGKAIGRPAGMTLAIWNQVRPAGIAAIGGSYVMSVFYREEDRVYASPGVMFWMKFNNKLHAFDHRYDSAIAKLPIEDITRKHILDHVLASFDFYKLHAFADRPFPGYR